MRSGASGLAGSPNLNGAGQRVALPATQTSTVPVATTAPADRRLRATVIVCPEITGLGVTVTVNVPAPFATTRM